MLYVLKNLLRGACTHFLQKFGNARYELVCHSVSKLLQKMSTCAPEEGSVQYTAVNLHPNLILFSPYLHLVLLRFEYYKLVILFLCH